MPFLTSVILLLRFRVCADAFACAPVLLYERTNQLRRFCVWADTWLRAFLVSRDFR